MAGSPWTSTEPEKWDVKVKPSVQENDAFFMVREDLKSEPSERKKKLSFNGKQWLLLPFYFLTNSQKHLYGLCESESMRSPSPFSSVPSPLVVEQLVAGVCRSQFVGLRSDRWRNPSLIAHSCFSFHPSGELKSPTTQRCFQIKYRLMNWKTCPHQACLCVYLWKASCGSGEREGENERKAARD